MKQLIAALAAAGLVATPALAATTHAKSSTKTIVTKGQDEKATTTVTTKVTPTSAKTHASTKKHARTAMAKSAHKPVKTAKVSTSASTKKPS